jgi:hypothetical protein
MLYGSGADSLVSTLTPMLKGPCAGIAVFIAFCSNFDTPRVHQNIGVGANLQFGQ